MNINDKVYNSEDNEWKANESTNLEDSDWGKFATGCLISIVGILVIGEISANFILYSKYANLVDKNTDDKDTYVSIMKNIDPFFSNHGSEKELPNIFGWLAHTKDYDVFYGHNNDDQKAPSLIGRIYNYFNPYEYLESQPDRQPCVDSMTTGLASIPKQIRNWLARSIAATYISFRQFFFYILILLHILPFTFQIWIFLFIIVFVGAGVTPFISGGEIKWDFALLIYIVTFLFFIISFFQADMGHPEGTNRNNCLNGLGSGLSMFGGSFLSLFLLPLVSTLIGYSMVLQFIFTFIIPYNIWRNAEARSAIYQILHEIKEDLLMMLLLFILIFAYLYLNVYSVGICGILLIVSCIKIIYGKIHNKK